MKNTLLAGSVLLLATTSLSAQWAQVTPTASPSGRGGQGMCSNPLTGGVLMFGGDTFGFPLGASNQTWSYNGSTWTQLTPAVSPPASSGVELVFDSNRGVFVTYGSLNTSPFGGASADRTWEFDGTNWTQIFPVTTPGGLGLYGMCFDSVRNKVVLYGGQVDPGILIISDQTWEYDGTNWSLVTTATSPGLRERPAMCFDSNVGKSVMFGGIDPFVGGTDDVWLYDGTDWSIAPITGVKPVPRTGPKMVYDNVRGVCVMSGGSDPNTGNNIVDTWELDLTSMSWTQVPTITTGRLNAGMAFVPSRRQVVQFGGWDFNTFTALNDTWEYGARSSTFGTGCPGSNGTPALDSTDAPRIGASYTMNLTGLNTTFNLGVLVLSTASIPATPLDAIGMTNCTAYVSPDLLLSLNGVGGNASFSLTIPNTVSLTGATVFGQGLSLDDVNPAWLTASNALAGTVGR